MDMGYWWCVGQGQRQSNPVAHICLFPKYLRATWISVEPRSLLVTRHDPSTIQKIGIDSKNALERAVEYFVKKFGGEKN